ncbi:vomeronasal 1 receptor oryCunV1R1649 [Oryctolagus cuniculus]|uniref:Vomeronasal type-1 receptor n=1 Tax=Oryctolagus cuniculus TaxID=9986 RepID=A0A5F9CGQ7_RABIT|nr:vomeronasal 1 receptor oryCunV1R1649 [Oryctolagus cuniculus]XP_051698194.1 vomeronasal type-1 receptor 1-like [Oryctolagus cuniculus]
MASAKLQVGIIFLTQMGVGIIGNSSLLCLYTFILLTGHKVRPTDSILNHLVLANSFVLFARGIPQAMAAFGLNYFLDEAACKLLFYLHRVARGVSLSTTCLLGGFQATKLCPNFSRWLELRMRSPKFISYCCFLFWILHLLLNIFVPIKMIGPMNSKNLSVKINYGYCSSLSPDRYLKFLVVFLFLTIDFLCLGLMVWASGSMVIVLYRHKQQVQYIHNSLSPRPSHEARATRTILILVSSFCSFYSLSSVLHMWMTVFVIPGQWLVDTSMILSSCFPAFSPFVLFCNETRFSEFHLACRVRKGRFPSLVVTM